MQAYPGMDTTGNVKKIYGLFGEFINYYRFHTDYISLAYNIYRN